MVELEDDDDWSTADDTEDEDNDSNAIAGESGLDRLACALGGKVTLPHILSNVPTMLQVSSLSFRFSNLVCIIVKSWQPICTSHWKILNTWGDTVFQNNVCVRTL